MVNDNQSNRSAEVPMSRVFDIERQKLLEIQAAVVNENARLQVANETIIARVRELEVDVEDLRDQRDRLAQTNDTLSHRLTVSEHQAAVIGEQYDRRLLAAGDMTQEDFDALHPNEGKTEDGD